MGKWRLNLLIVAFWLAAMTWLVQVKLVPDWRRGTPPVYHVANHRGQPQDSVVCWAIELVQPDGAQGKAPERLGWAAGRVVPRTADRTELQSRVQLWKIPVTFGAPMLWSMLRLSPPDLQHLELGISTSIHLDSNARLTRFESAVFLGETTPWATITGLNNDGQLEVYARRGKDKPQPVGSYYLGDEAVVNDGNAPRGVMPELTLGQKWKTQQLSPLKTGAGGDISGEELEAEVVRQEEIIWDGHHVLCWLVEFRRDEGAGSRWAETPLRQMWVRPADGMVLREDITVLGRKLKFLRVPSDEADGLVARLEKNWSARIEEDALTPGPKRRAEGEMKNHAGERPKGE
jgi:hypothetical protein